MPTRQNATVVATMTCVITDCWVSAVPGTLVCRLHEAMLPGHVRARLTSAAEWPLDTLGWLDAIQMARAWVQTTVIQQGWLCAAQAAAARA